MKHFLYTGSCIICGIFLSIAALDIPSECVDWVPVEYDREFFPEYITHVINNQYQV